MTKSQRETEVARILDNLGPRPDDAYAIEISYPSSGVWFYRRATDLRFHVGRFMTWTARYLLNKHVPEAARCGDTVAARWVSDALSRYPVNVLWAVERSPQWLANNPGKPTLTGERV